MWFQWKNLLSVRELTYEFLSKWVTDCGTDPKPSLKEERTEGKKGGEEENDAFLKQAIVPDGESRWKKQK